MPQATGAENRNTQIQGRRLDHLSNRLAEPVASVRPGQRQIVIIEEDRDYREVEVRAEVVRRTHEGMAHADIWIRHFLAASQIEFPLDQTSMKLRRQFRASTHRYPIVRSLLQFLSMAGRLIRPADGSPAGEF